MDRRGFEELVREWRVDTERISKEDRYTEIKGGQEYIQRFTKEKIGSEVIYFRRYENNKKYRALFRKKKTIGRFQ